MVAGLAHDPSLHHAQRKGCLLEVQGGGCLLEGRDLLPGSQDSNEPQVRSFARVNVLPLLNTLP